MKQNPLKQIVTMQKQGKKVGIYSCCSANPYVIRAALSAAKRDQSCVLIEATANQVDQFGGYTGMTPQAFRDFVYDIAKQVDLSQKQIFLGGDHLGPLTFADQKEAQAMKSASELVRAYVLAGFTKIHIDTSMKVADDDPDQRLSDDVIARRGAALVKECEAAYQQRLQKYPNALRPVYIIGSEVPIPGGALDTSNTLTVTKESDLDTTVSAFQRAFEHAGLQKLWDDVIGVVVQPGMEEHDNGCTEYDRRKASALMARMQEYPHLVLEGHSSDYQTKYKLRELVEDGVAILKVGPALTYALREALFALTYMEEILYHDRQESCSHFITILEQAMSEEPKHWQKHYQGDEQTLWFKRKFSFSDRARYYLTVPDVIQSQKKLITNLRNSGIPLSLLSQFMPMQYTKVREHTLSADPEALILDHITDTIDTYLYATHQSELRFDRNDPTCQ